jgi:mannose/fructose/N-acetylgalactosamine-specific phosphotransferase system component IIC
MLGFIDAAWSLIVVATLGGLVAMLYYSGKRSAQAEQQEKNNQSLEQEIEIREKVHASQPADINDVIDQL